MLDSLILILPIVLPLLVGWAVVRAKILSRADSHVLSIFFVHIAAPSLLIHVFASQDLERLFDVRYMMGFLFLTLVLYGGVFIVERVFLGRRIEVSAFAAFTGAKFNAVVLGLPVLLATIGHVGSGPVMMNLILGYVTILPLTLVLANLSRQENSAGASRILIRALKDVIKDPLVLSAIIGLILGVTQIHLPVWLDKTLQSLGAATLPTALVASGMSISTAALKEDVFELVWVSGVRMILSPALAIVVAIVFGLSPVFAIALVLSFGIPTAQMVVALCEEEEVEYTRPAAAIVTTTTLALVATLPVLIWVCNQLWPGILKGGV
jgi:predicted permease